MPRSVASDLGLYYVLCPTQRTLSYYGFKLGWPVALYIFRRPKRILLYFHDLCSWMRLAGQSYQYTQGDSTQPCIPKLG